MQANLVTPTKIMHAGFIGSIACFLGAFFLDKTLPDNMFVWVLIGALVVSSIVFYVGLGLLAKRLGKSQVLWIGGAFVTAPIGPIVAYITMLSILKNRP